MGCILYELLTGSPPFEGTDVVKVILAHMAEVPPPPSARKPGIPQALDADLFLSIGTSGSVYPAAGMVLEASLRGKLTVEVNLEEAENSRHFRHHVLGKAGTVVPRLVDEVLSRLGAPSSVFGERRKLSESAEGDRPGEHRRLPWWRSHGSSFEGRDPTQNGREPPGSSLRRRLLAARREPAENAMAGSEDTNSALPPIRRLRTTTSTRFVIT